MEIIKTDRLILRQPRSSDNTKLLFLINDRNIKYYVPYFDCEDISDIDFLIKGPFDLKTTFMFVIENNQNQNIIGIIYAYITTGHKLDIIYAIKSEERGNGFMSEAIKFFIQYLYNKEYISSINFSIHASNKSSQRVMEKLNILPSSKIENFTNYTLSLQEKPSF